MTPRYGMELDTPWGTLAVIHDSDAVLASGFTTVECVGGAPDHHFTGPLAERIASAVARWQRGELDALQDVPVHQEGTPLQQRGWQALRGILPGRPLSYAEFGALLDTGPRVAAQICARNRVAPFVPCHRVRRGDGSLGGYRWGTEIKKALLRHEAGRPLSGSLPETGGEG